MQILDQNSFSFFDQPQSNNNIPSKNNSSLIKITQKCTKNHIYNKFCINNRCQSQQKFLCQDDQCQCNQKHQLCQKVTIKSVLKKIDQKLTINMEKLKNKIYEFFSKLINKISFFEENIMKKLDNDLKYIQLMEIQKVFYQIFKEQKDENFKYFNESTKLVQLLEIIRTQQENKNKQSQILMINYLQKIRIYQETSIKQIQKFQGSINQLVNKFNKSKEKIQSKQQSKLSQPRLLYLNFIFPAFSSSSIISNQVQVNNLISFFPHKISSINLLFKASEHQFNIKKYYQICGNIQNTIILCQTTKNKIIGGYTPLSFNPSLSSLINNQKQKQKSQQQKKWIESADHSHKSFVFSLSNNDKFQLKQPHKAIIKSSTKESINFGWGLFAIGDKANINQNSAIKNMTVLWNKVYQNKMYKNDKTSYNLLNGNSNEFYLAKQWEVFKVQFSS